MKLTDLSNSNQTPIEVALQVDEKGMTTAKKLYTFLQLNPSNYSKWCRNNTTENQYAEEGTDFWPFVLDDERYNPNPTTDYKITAAFAKKLAMISKSERGEQARIYFLEVENRLKGITVSARGQLSPQLVLLTEMVNAMAQQELKVKQIEDTLAVIKDTIIQRDDGWRRSINKMFNNAVMKSGEEYKVIRQESYDILEERAHCNLGVRLANLQSRLRENGASKSKINTTTRMDVIEEDPRLKEIYGAVVKEFSIHHM